MDLLYANYYGNLPDAEQAAFAAIRSVTGLLDDPNTSFLTPQEADYYRSGMEGAFEGIGARVGWDEEADTLVITEPSRTGRWLAGLRPPRPHPGCSTARASWDLGMTGSRG